MPEVHAVLDRDGDFSNRVRSGAWTGHTGKRIRNVVNIGIGGSDLGPVMAYEALKHYSDRALTFRFVSNVDGTDFAEAVRDLDPAETLFIVSSKTFTTLETMTNAAAARAMVARRARRRRQGRRQAFRRRLDERRGRCRSSGSTPRTCSGSGTGSAAAIRWTRRSACRRCSPSVRIISARCSTASTRWTSTSAPRRSSATCRCCWGCLTVWYTNFFGAETVAVLPYEQYLKRFPAYLQQLTMESNGKHVTLDGAEVDYPTGPDLLGRAGHQRPALVLSADSSGDASDPLRLHRLRPRAEPARPASRHAAGERVRADRGAGVRQDRASRSKAEGTPDGLVPHRVFEGNRPSNTILAERLTPEALGKLVALYEHSVFTQGVIWNIDSFDQWGVELGKVLAQRIIPELESEHEPALDHDSSTNNLIRRYRRRLRGCGLTTMGRGAL